MVKKKKTVSPESKTIAMNSSNLQELSVETTDETTDQHSEPTNTLTTKTIPSFKSQEWISNRYSNNSKKTKVWKSLKQILSSDKTSSLSGFPYPSLDCQPSRKPAKRYSDLSGLPAKYKDPTTQLLYHNLDEFALIKTFSNDLINGYLELRKANL